MFKLFSWLFFAASVGLLVKGFWAQPEMLQSYWASAADRRMFAALTLGHVAAVLLLSALTPRLLKPAALLFAASFLVTVLGPLPLAIACVCFLAFLVTGDAVIGRLLERRAPSELHLPLSVATGACLYSFSLSLLSALPIHTPLTYAVAVGAPILLGYRSVGVLLSHLGMQLLGKAPKRTEALAWGVLAYPFIFLLLQLCRPNVSYDPLSVHIPLAHTVFANGFWHYDVIHFVWAAMPKGVNWLYTLAYVLGGEFAAQLMNVGFLSVLVSLIVGMCSWAASRSAALIAGAVFVSSPIVLLETANLMVENPWSAFVTAGFASIFLYHRTSRPGYLPLSGLLLGTALASKLPAAFIIIAAAAAGFAALYMAGRLRSSTKLVAFSGVVLGLAGCYPYLKSYLLTGNPLFPFFNAVFQSPMFYTTSSFEQPNYVNPVGLTTLYDVTFASSRYLESDSGAPGLQYVLLLPLAALCVFRRRSYIPFVALFSALFFIIVEFRFQAYLRYIYPAFPLLTVAGAHMWTTLRRDSRTLSWPVGFAAIALVLANSWLFPATSWAHRDLPVTPLLAGVNDSDIGYRAPERRLITYLNLFYGRSAKVLFLARPNVAELSGEAVTASWHSSWFWESLMKATTEEEVAALVGRERVSHIVAFRTMKLEPAVARFLRLRAVPEMEYSGAVLYRVRPNGLIATPAVESSR